MCVCDQEREQGVCVCLCVCMPVRACARARARVTILDLVGGGREVGAVVQHPVVLPLLERERGEEAAEQVRREEEEQGGGGDADGGAEGLEALAVLELVEGREELEGAD